jgi:hypothetical protein
VNFFLSIEIARSVITLIKELVLNEIGTGLIMAHLFSVKNDNQVDALLERDLFLREHPELREFQRKIDERLRRAGSTHNRLVVIYEMMMDSFMELNTKLQEASAILH